MVARRHLNVTLYEHRLSFCNKVVSRIECSLQNVKLYIYYRTVLHNFITHISALKKNRHQYFFPGLVDKIS